MTITLHAHERNSAVGRANARTKKPRSRGALLQADDGTRTHDLLHGNWMAADPLTRRERGWLNTFCRYEALEAKPSNQVVSVRFDSITALSPRSAETRPKRRGRNGH